MNRVAQLGLVFLLVLTLGYMPGLAPKRAALDFYSAAAQIIPVLLLVLALEARIFRLQTMRRVEQKPQESKADHRRRRSTDDLSLSLSAGVLLFTLVMLVVGTFAALHPLATGQAADGNPRAVYSALAAGFVCIAYIAVIAPRDDH